jgi:hypothetical protein
MAPPFNAVTMAIKFQHEFRKHQHMELLGAYFLTTEFFKTAVLGYMSFINE